MQPLYRDCKWFTINRERIKCTKKSEINRCPSISVLINYLTSCSGVKQLEIFKQEVPRKIKSGKITVGDGERYIGILLLVKA